jgi:hypothetical protein
MTPEEYAERQLNIFYGPSWLTRDTTLDQFQFSGYDLGEKVQVMERVIHINCGDNPFKGMVPNLVGQDPYNSKADTVMTMDQFAYTNIAQKFNVAFVLGGINYGTQAEIDQQIATVVKLLRKRDGRIYWRCYTQPPVGGPPNFFAWDYTKQMAAAAMFNFEIIDMEADTGNTIYAEWWSNSRSSTYGPT